MAPAQTDAVGAICQQLRSNRYGGVMGERQHLNRHGGGNGWAAVPERTQWGLWKEHWCSNRHGRGASESC